MRVTLIRCTIHINGRWAVAGIAGAHDEVDLPVMRDPRTPGRSFLPGSSLAGSLRDRLETDLAETWLGPDIGAYGATLPKGQPAKLWAGRLTILGTRPIDAKVAARGVTAVDRERGAALPGALRTEESVEGGLVTLLMEHEGVADDHLLDRLASWRPLIGRSRTTGLGDGTVTRVEAVTVDLATSVDHLTWWLRERTAYLLGTVDPPAGASVETREGSRADRLRPVALTVVEPLHIGVLDNAGEGRVQPTLHSHDGVPFVPGSSWKGVFRHRVAFILDAVGASAEQRVDITEALFGGPRAGRGLLTFADSPIEASKTETRTHVAIDRFTGGARDGSLFTLESVPRGSRLELRLGGASHPAVGNLVNHVLRDLTEGLIGIGGHGSRGYGWVACLDMVPPVAPVNVAQLHAHLMSRLILDVAQGGAE